MKLYISGKMSGLPENRIRHRFNEAAEYLRNEGHVPVNPAVMLDDPGLEYEEYMDIDFKMLEHCDGIYMLRGWEKSIGARREIAKAIRLGLQVMLEE